jgi:hypothetical protein
MCERSTEYEFTLRDGSKRYEIVYDRADVFVFIKMHKAVAARPVKRELGSPS